MLQHLAYDADFQKSALVLGPALITFFSLLIIRPSKKIMISLFLGFLWNIALLFPCNMLAIDQEWWSFKEDKNNLLGIPIDILIGWAVFWGVLPYLFFKGKLLWLVLPLVIFIDLVAMPKSAPFIQLGENWLYGEMLVICICLLPGLALSFLTHKDRHVRIRAFMQAIITYMLLFNLNAYLLQLTGNNIFSITSWPTWKLNIFMNLIFLVSIPALSANQEFAIKGNGTPLPFDAPKTLVTTGPYAYIANPMQLSVFLTLLITSVAYSNIAILGASIMSIIFSIGFVKWHQDNHIAVRFGEDWSNYKSHVKNWIPRWCPYILEQPTIYFRRSCGICSNTEYQISRLNPIGLTFKNETEHSSAILNRATYRYANGYEESGVKAIARSIEHINLGWAFLGWFMRLPLITEFLQILVDGVGNKPKAY